MQKITRLYLLVIVAVVLLAAAISYSVGSNGPKVAGLPISLWCAVIAISINWLAFIPANIAKTEKYYDLTGSFTYLSVITFAFMFGNNQDVRSIIVAILVVVWAVRLGSFLFLRILTEGGDDRFNDIKPVTIRFFMAWTLQALWVTVTSASALAIISGGNTVELSLLGIVGIAVWVVGFAVEAVADWQKARFRKNLENKGNFISSGLWSWSRHPNYFGEILLWIGVTIIALPILEGLQWIALISPVFVYFLLMKISGVNKLEKKADDKWGGSPAYLNYKSKTSLLWLFPPKK